MAKIQHGGVSGSVDLSHGITGSASSTQRVIGGVTDDSINGTVSSTHRVNGSAAAMQRIIGNAINGVSGKKEVVSNTTEGWNSQITLISQKDVIYVYTDYKVVDEKQVPNIKIGDGNAYLIDLPFAIPNMPDIEITQEQINYWNNKVAVMLDILDPENVIFYTDMI